MGSSRIELSPEEVQEYQVVNNGLSAELGVLQAARSTWLRAQAQTSSEETPFFMPKVPCSMLKIPSKPRPASQTFAAIASGIPLADPSLRIACSFMRLSSKKVTVAKSAPT
jgi:hypothetical protein